MRSFRVAKVARVRARFRLFRGEKELLDRGQDGCYYVHTGVLLSFFNVRAFGLVSSSLKCFLKSILRY